MSTVDSALRCAEFAREVELDPIGTAGSYDGYLLIEWPLPWPREIGECEDLAPVVAALKGTGLRLQGLVPESDDDARRVVLYRRRPGDGFSGYDRAERVVPGATLVDAAVEMATADESMSVAATNDVLVCTHGKRDVCCGSMGTALARGLAGWDGPVRLWRTSHTGGHRFAPTAIVLPQGTLWAFADADLLRSVVLRTGAASDAMPRYRGCAGLGSPRIQAVEREAFGVVGWGWLDWARRGEELDDGRVRVVGTSPAGERLAVTGVVDVTREVPVPDCGRPIDEAKKSEPELSVREVRFE